MRSGKLLHASTDRRLAARQPPALMLPLAPGRVSLLPPTLLLRLLLLTAIIYAKPPLASTQSASAVLARRVANRASHAADERRARGTPPDGTTVVMATVAAAAAASHGTVTPLPPPVGAAPCLLPAPTGTRSLTRWPAYSACLCRSGDHGGGVPDALAAQYLVHRSRSTWLR